MQTLITSDNLETAKLLHNASMIIANVSTFIYRKYDRVWGQYSKAEVRKLFRNEFPVQLQNCDKPDLLEIH